MISKQCKEEIEIINELVNKALNEIENANNRALKAENILKTIKETTEENMKKAYILGFNEGLKNLNYKENEEASGGTSKENETRLVLKPD